MSDSFDTVGFKKVADELIDPIVVTDSAGRITWINRAFRRLCGYATAEILGRKPGACLQGPLTDPLTREELSEAIEQRRPIQVEILNYHKKGHSYWASLSVTPFFNEAGVPVGFVGIVRDTTEKQIQLHQLECDVVQVYRALLSEISEANEPLSMTEL